MRMKDYLVLVTFDLNYAKSKDYNAVNAFLESKGFETLSHRGHDLPSNTYLGTENIPLLGSETTNDGAERLKKKIYSSIKGKMNGDGLQSVVFVMVSPKDGSAYSCSKPKDY
ncbi:hypothetical protein [Citrobacter youngae]|uniref:hypothetical protein n=1 Tax=Citrobacter youngae TaxID=133448 RepID=UPI003EE21159